MLSRRHVRIRWHPRVQQRPARSLSHVNRMINVMDLLSSRIIELGLMRGAQRCRQIDGTLHGSNVTARLLARKGLT